MLVAKVKLFRMKYGISRAELGSALGVTPQWIYALENATGSITPTTAHKLFGGMEAIIRQRQTWVDRLHADLLKHGDTLLELVEENSYEL